MPTLECAELWLSEPFKRFIIKNLNLKKKEKNSSVYILLNNMKKLDLT
jgi:hypothetical protein